jgi:ubiquinone/menaquinone biosynthesis C-methylase UbiE
MDRPLLRIRVSDTARSAVVGYTRDANIEGCFLCTSMQLRIGDLLPVSLASEEGEVDAEMEVVRVAPDGFGLRIRSMGAADRKKFRRIVAKANSVVGARNAAERVLSEDRRTTQPIRDAGRIRAVLVGAVGARLRLMAADQDRLWDGVIVGASENAGVQVSLGASPPVGTLLLGVLDHGHVNYAFRSVVCSVSGGSVEIALPEELGFAERRSRERVLVDGTWLVLPLPWSTEQSFRVVEVGPGGFSLRVQADRWLLDVGSPIHGALLRDDGGDKPLIGAVVASVAADPAEAGTVRVGVAMGPARREVLAERTVVSGNRFARLRARVADILANLLGRVPVARPKAPVSLDRKVHFPNRVGQQVVGVLDFAQEDAGTEMPLVIVVPGFGGRKEQMSQLATTLTDTFRRHHADIAVLRFDGTNNLGESEKDAGNEVEGKHTLHYRLSGVEADLLGALDWAHRNDRVRPTSIIVVSVSFAACAVMHLLAQPEVQKQFPEVRLWISYMGAPEPRDAVLHVSGHHDAAAAANESHRLVTLIGCIVDAHVFWSDVQKLGVGTLVESERDMGNVRADVMWIAGQHDGWMDLARVRRVMSVEASGARRLVVADSGHVPRSGREAQKQFALITQQVWTHLHKTTIPEWFPPLTRLNAQEQAEWKAARSARPSDATAFWRRYLLADGGLGFDVLAWYPSYREFIDSQADAVDPVGRDVLELGAGTGNLTLALASRVGPAGLGRIIAMDLVPEALDRLREKVPGVQTRVADLEGRVTTVMRRFVAGDIRTFSGLRGRVPVAAEVLMLLDRAAERDSGVARRLIAAASGRPVDLQGLAARADIGASGVAGLETLAGLAAAAQQVSADLDSGLPFEDARFDRVAMSLVLSYLQNPEDLLFEIRRVLRPGGELVISSMVRDADTSALFNACVVAIQAASPEQLGGEAAREPLLSAARHMLDAASALFRLEEEGHYRFYDPEEFEDMLTLAGFEVLEAWGGFGSPAQAICMRCRRA